VMIVETLEIDFVKIDPRMKIFEHLRSAVTVRNECGQKAGRASLLEDGYRPFAGDEGFVVGADDHLCALQQRVFDQDFRIGSQRLRYPFWISQCLRRDPVLAIRTVEIAAQHSKTVGERSRIGVEERLLLDGIALYSGHISPRNVELAALIEANFTYPRLTLVNRAAVAAGVATDAIAVDRFAEGRVGPANVFVENVAQGGHICILRLGIASVAGRGRMVSRILR